MPEWVIFQYDTNNKFQVDKEVLILERKYSKNIGGS